MTVVRWGRSAGSTPTANPRFRWGRSAGSGTIPVTPRVRWGRSAVSGAAAALLDPIAGVTVEPMTEQTFTAVPSGLSVTPDSYTWRRVSGAACAVSSSVASVTILAPSAYDGTSVVLGVVGVKGGEQGPEQTFTVTTRPHLLWEFDSGLSLIPVGPDTDI